MNDLLLNSYLTSCVDVIGFKLSKWCDLFKIRKLIHEVRTLKHGIDLYQYNAIKFELINTKSIDFIKFKTKASDLITVN